MPGIDVRVWRQLLALRSAAPGAVGSAVPASDHPLVRDVYLPLIARIARGPLTLAQLGQSIDGRIATESGHAQFINGADGLDHLHRLRALADAVVVGAGTAVLDDPQLTTRRVEGPNPVRVVLDPHARVPADRRCFDAAAPTLRLVGEDTPVGTAAEAGNTGDGPGVVRLPAPGGAFRPQDVLAVLHRRGLRAVLIEGGSTTVSRFVQAAALDRLHVMVAPLLLGSGVAGVRLPVVERLDEARRFRMRAHVLGTDVLLDCRLRDDDG